MKMDKEKVIKQFLYETCDKKTLEENIDLFLNVIPNASERETIDFLKRRFCFAEWLTEQIERM